MTVNTKVSTEWDGKRRTLHEATCKACKREFWFRPRVSHGQFCSVICHGEWVTKHNTKVLSCGGCGKEFRVRNSIAAKPTTSNLRFCSRKCKDEAQRMENGNTAMWPDHYGTGEADYRSRSAELLRNGCVDCGERRMWLLQVHHLDGNRNNNKLLNLEVVCANDHEKRHLRRVGGEWIRDMRFLTPRDMLSTL